MKTPRLSWLLILSCAPVWAAGPDAFRPEPADRPAFGGPAAGLPAFPVDFRGRPAPAEDVAIPKAAINVVFFVTTFDAANQQFVTSEYVINPKDHDVRIQYRDAVTDTVREIRANKPLIVFEPSQMAGPDFTILYTFPGQPERRQRVTLTREDFDAGRNLPVKGISAFKVLEIRAPHSPF